MVPQHNPGELPKNPENQPAETTMARPVVLEATR